MGLFTINKDLWRIKAHYFLFNAGTAPVQPFLSVYMKSLGYSSTIVGIIFSILPISGMIMKPVMGGIADKYKCQKTIFLLMQALTALAFLSILYVPPVKNDRKAHFSCDYSEMVLDTCLVSDKNQAAPFKLNLPNGTTTCKLNCPILNENEWIFITEQSKVLKTIIKEGNNSVDFKVDLPLDLADPLNMHCIYFRAKHLRSLNDTLIDKPCLNGKISANCTITCDFNGINKLLPKSIIEDGSVTNTYQFWLLLILLVISWFSQAVVVSVSDAVCFSLLGDEPNKYGMQRMFGSLGWGIFSVIAGLLIDAFSENDSEKDYTSVFYLSLCVLILDIIVSYKLKYDQQKTSPNICRDVTQLLIHLPVFIFLTWLFFVGMCTGLVWNFLFWLVEELIVNRNWLKTLEGIIMGIQCLGGELPFFFLSGIIIKKLGHVNCMTLVLLALGLRFVSYTLLTDVWFILPIELSGGITYGLFYACMASYASIVAPPGTETTIQGLVGAIFETGVSLGTFLGGLSIDAFKSVVTFRIFGITAIVVCFLHAGVQFLVKKRNKDQIQYTVPEENDDIFLSDEQELKLVD